MQHPVTDDDHSAYEASVRRLTWEMREMLGMGPAANLVSKAAIGTSERPVPISTSAPPR